VQWKWCADTAGARGSLAGTWQFVGSDRERP